MGWRIGACPNIPCSSMTAASSPPVPLPMPAAVPAPTMAQYLAIKAEFPDTLKFDRMGDFDRLFYDDVRKAARLLDTMLTHAANRLVNRWRWPWAACRCIRSKAIWHACSNPASR